MRYGPWILNTFHKDDPLFQGFANISVPVAISGVGYGSATLPHRRHRQSTRFTQADRAYVGARVSANRLYHRTVVLADADASVPAAAHRGRSQIGAQRTVLNNVCAHFSTPEAHMEYALITAMSPFAMM